MKVVFKNWYRDDR